MKLSLLKVVFKYIVYLGYYLCIFFCFFSQVFRITSTTFYTAASFICRSLTALGCAAYFSGSTAIVAQIFRDNITFAMSISETFAGLGLICGPILGGWLYQVMNGMQGFAKEGLDRLCSAENYVKTEKQIFVGFWLGFGVNAGLG